MATIDMTPENKPLLDALMRLIALGRNADAEDMLVEAILELVDLRKQNAVMRSLLQEVLDRLADGWQSDHPTINAIRALLATSHPAGEAGPQQQEGE